MTERLTSDPEGIARAAAFLSAGRCVGFPTETVYGLGADATSDRAVAAIFEAKDRPRFNPLIVHLPDPGAVAALCDMPEAAERLAAAFWPGALTLVLPLRSGAGISPLVTAGLETLAVRVPDHAVARELLRAVGRPVAAPSANPSGRLSPTTAAHVLAGLDGRIAAVLDGGPCGVGVESTIVGFDPGPVLLRPGGLPREALEACLGGTLGEVMPGRRPVAPGQLVSHYAPRGALRMEATVAREGEVLVGFGAVAGAVSLSAAGDLVEAAAALFPVLHRLDAAGVERIAVAPIPETGLGLAINDRLRRAAAPRG